MAYRVPAFSNEWRISRRPKMNNSGN